MPTIKNAILRVNRFFAEICGWLLIAVMILMILDFVSRGLSDPIQGVGEIAVFVMVAIVYLGVAHTEQTRGHVRVTAVITRLPPRVQNVISLMVYVLALATIAVVVWAVTKNAVKAFKSQEAVAGTVPLLVWPVKFVIVLGCIMYFLQVAINTKEELQKLFSRTN